MQTNNTILVGGLLIISIGFINAVVNNRPKTPVFAGGVGFLLLASLIDSFGGQAAKLATSIVGLATVTVLIVEGPALVTALQNSQKGK
jgi:hypothetical protein